MLRSKNLINIFVLTVFNGFEKINVFSSFKRLRNKKVAKKKESFSLV